jgi:hypothetical protein
LKSGSQHAFAENQPVPRSGGAISIDAQVRRPDGLAADDRFRRCAGRERVLDPVVEALRHGAPGGARQHDVDVGRDRRRRRDAPCRVAEARYLAGVVGQRVAAELEEPLPAAAHYQRGERGVGGEAVRDHEVVVDVFAPVGAVDALRRPDRDDLERRGGHCARGNAWLDGRRPSLGGATGSGNQRRGRDESGGESEAGEPAMP